MIAAQIPPNAVQHLPTVQHEVREHFPELSFPFYFGGLFEHESCITVTHARCWSSTSEFKTSREQGVGLAMLTRVWRENGTVRFDTVEDLRQQFPKELKDLRWETIKETPHLQIRAGILLVRQNHRQFSRVPEAFDRLAMADAAYNGGPGNVAKARKICGLTKGCDPNRWFNHVEKHMPQSRKVLYGKRSAYDIVTHHVSDVMLVRGWKYREHLY